MPTATMSPDKAVRCLRAYTLILLGTLALTLSAQAPPAGAPKPQRHEYRHEIDQLEAAWRDAVIKADTTALDALLADDYIAILPNGTLQTKEQTLASLHGGAAHFTDIKVSDRRVRFYGSTALVTSRTDVNGTSASGPISGSFRYTRVYVRDQQGKWKIVSFEASRILGEGKKK